MAQNYTTPARPGDSVAAPTGRAVPHADWGAIIAGAFVATAIAFILNAFGAAIGFSIVSPFPGHSASGTWVAIIVGLWVLWVAGSSNMAGGYVAGRMRRRAYDATPHESDVRDIIHGLVVWALAVIAGAILATSVATSVARSGAEAASSLVGGAASAAGQAVDAMGDEGGNGPLDYVVSQMTRPALPNGEGAQSGSAANAAAPASMGRPMPDQARGEILTVLGHAMDGEEGVPDADKAYLTEIVARYTGLPQDQARARVDQAISQIQQAVDAAQEAAETARQTAIVAAFLLAASLLVGGAGACWGAQIGGRHRDEGTDFSRWFPRR